MNAALCASCRRCLLFIWPARWVRVHFSSPCRYRPSLRASVAISSRSLRMISKISCSAPLWSSRVGSTDLSASPHSAHTRGLSSPYLVKMILQSSPLGPRQCECEALARVAPQLPGFLFLRPSSPARPARQKSQRTVTLRLPMCTTPSTFGHWRLFACCGLFHQGWPISSFFRIKV